MVPFRDDQALRTLAEIDLSRGGYAKEIAMQTLQDDYFAVNRSLKATQDASGVLVVEIYNNGDPLIFTPRIIRSSSTRFYRVAQDRANKMVILTGADGNFIPDIDLILRQLADPMV